MSNKGKKVLIAGGGLAGLACAARLHEAGAAPHIFEESDGVGGRVRTDEVDGFLLDRGFQVFLDAYPEAGNLLNKESLDLRKFKAGALIYQNSGMERVMDVFREPRHLIQSALAPWRVDHRSQWNRFRSDQQRVRSIRSRAGLRTFRMFADFS